MINIPVAETIVHENYVSTSSSQANDIALVRLQLAAPYTDFIRPICLPVQDCQGKNYDGSTLTVIGFGKTENGMHYAHESIVLEDITNELVNLIVSLFFQHHEVKSN